MEVGQPHTLGVEGVEVGSPNLGVSMRTDVAVPLVIRDDQDDVRPGVGRA